MKQVISLVALACIVSPAIGQKAHVDFDRACDFSRYQTYRWVASPNEQPLNQLMQERVVGFVEEALSARRLKRVPSGGDLLISYHVKVTEQPQFVTYTDAFGPGWGWGWGGSSISTTYVDP